MEKESKIYELKMWDGQIPIVGNNVEWLPSKVCFNNIEERKDEQELHYFTVIGNMWDIEFNVGFKFYKGFQTEEQADAFFQAFKKKYPHSKFYLREKTSTILKEYY